jgi:alanine racemase
MSAHDAASAAGLAVPQAAVPQAAVPQAAVQPAAVPHAVVEVDLAAVRHNVGVLRERARDAELMAVVKADAYGHGLVPVASAARAAGAEWLATAVLAEALTLRAAGDTGRLLCWLTAPGEDFDAALAADVDVSAAALWQLDEVLAAARRVGRPARVHLKIDTGLGRNGAGPADWPELVTAAGRAQAEGAVVVAGIWSHFAYADAPGHPTVLAQRAAFEEAVAVAAGLGVTAERRHLANSAATLTAPEAHYDLVRPGLALYGLSPVPDVADAAALGLRPAMTVRARVALVKAVPAGHGVSYGHQYVTPAATRLALVPLGYADGVPRHASGRGPVLVGGPASTGGAVRPVAGRVCMDQFVLDVGGLPVEAGDEVVLFGPGDDGEPTAEDWAQASGTISYEIVTRMSTRLPRRWLGG